MNNIVLLVHVLQDGVALNSREELEGLAVASGAEVAGIVTARVRVPDARFFVGAGKTDEIRQLVIDCQCDLVIVNVELTPSQERNLEKRIACRAIDRTRLILDIFALRARSHEGKLQVELAQLNYLATRLVRGWTHLERQRGGIGLRGPGETQLESDRRMLVARVTQLKKLLAEVNQRRQLGRRARNTCVVALAGYTNAGKTSLFNLLCKDTQYVADQLFASLDTRLRRLALPGTRPAVLVDTVGFVENLPHQLIEAFASTLEEVVQADLVLHLCDASDPRRTEKIHAVEKVLDEIGAGSIPRLMVWNKSDLLDEFQKDLLHLQTHCSHPHNLREVAISVASKEGIDQLLHMIVDMLIPVRVTGWHLLDPHCASHDRAWLHKHNAVKQESCTAHGELCLLIDVDAAVVQPLKGLRKL